MNTYECSICHKDDIVSPFFNNKARVWGQDYEFICSWCVTNKQDMSIVCDRCERTVPLASMDPKEKVCKGCVFVALVLGQDLYENNKAK